jgi:hypothetical protein
LTKYNTNLAAEFWVLSMLPRLGADAALTLGNKKAVDILITGDRSALKTVDVKGLERQYDWPADNIRLPAPPKHFYVFLTFDGKISDPKHAPSVWIVPGNNVKPFIKTYKTRSVVSRSRLLHEGDQYKEAWSVLIGPSAA